MNTSFVTRITRRKIAAVAVGVAATAALAVPGVAWAQNAIPGSSPVAVATPAAQLTPASAVTDVSAGDADGKNCSASVKPLSDEELQKLIDEGTISTDPTVIDDGTGAVSMSISVATTEATPVDGVALDDASVDAEDAAVTVTSMSC